MSDNFDKVRALYSNGFDKVRALYDEGFDDDQIAEKLNIRSHIVTTWRRANRLRVHRYKVVAQKQPKIKSARSRGKYPAIDPMVKDEAFTTLYDYGCNDEAISYLCHVARDTVKKWRMNKHLPIVHQITLSEAKRQIKYYNINTAETKDPSEDPESLYYSTSTLHEIKLDVYDPEGA